jgi:hypothetical protein
MESYLQRFSEHVFSLNWPGIWVPELLPLSSEARKRFFEAAFETCKNPYLIDALHRRIKESEKQGSSTEKWKSEHVQDENNYDSQAPQLQQSIESKTLSRTSAEEIKQLEEDSRTYIREKLLLAYPNFITYVFKQQCQGDTKELDRLKVVLGRGKLESQD